MGEGSGNGEGVGLREIVGGEGGGMVTGLTDIVGKADKAVDVGVERMSLLVVGTAVSSTSHLCPSSIPPPKPMSNRTITIANKPVTHKKEALFLGTNYLAYSNMPVTPTKAASKTVRV